LKLLKEPHKQTENLNVKIFYSKIKFLLFVNNLWLLKA